MRYIALKSTRIMFNNTWSVFLRGDIFEVPEKLSGHVISKISELVRLRFIEEYKETPKKEVKEIKVEETEIEGEIEETNDKPSENAKVVESVEIKPKKRGRPKVK